MGWWDNGEDQKAKSQWSSQTRADSESGMCLIPARHPGQHPPGTGTNKSPLPAQKLVVCPQTVEAKSSCIYLGFVGVFFSCFTGKQPETTVEKCQFGKQLWNHPAGC